MAPYSDIPSHRWIEKRVPAGKDGWVQTVQQTIPQRRCEGRSVFGVFALGGKRMGGHGFAGDKSGEGLVGRAAI